MKPETKKFWYGSTPKLCDLCKGPFSSTFYDARTKGGQWGLLCHACFTEHSLGLGLGQAYDITTLEKIGG